MKLYKCADCNKEFDSTELITTPLLITDNEITNRCPFCLSDEVREIEEVE